MMPKSPHPSKRASSKTAISRRELMARMVGCSSDKWNYHQHLRLDIRATAAQTVSTKFPTAAISNSQSSQMIVVRHQVSLICRDTHRTQLVSLTKNSSPWGLRKTTKITTTMKQYLNKKKVVRAICQMKKWVWNKWASCSDHWYKTDLKLIFSKFVYMSSIYFLIKK